MNTLPSSLFAMTTGAPALDLSKIWLFSTSSAKDLRTIRKALEEGFKERKLFMAEPEFADLRTTPEFKELMTLEPRVL